MRNQEMSKVMVCLCRCNCGSLKKLDFLGLNINLTVIWHKCKIYVCYRKAENYFI